MYRLMKKCLIPIFTLLTVALHAQVHRYEDMWRPTFSIRQSANVEDYLLGFTIGASTPKRNLITYGSFDFRPGQKRIQEQVSGNFYRQYAEKRFFTGIGVEYLHHFNKDNKGIFACANGNYTWGNYGGTYAKPQKGFNIVPRLGFFMSFYDKSIFTKLGYEYLDTKSAVSEHRLFFSIVFVINPSR
jgi:hypothetical protein